MNEFIQMHLLGSATIPASRDEGVAVHLTTCFHHLGGLRDCPFLEPILHGTIRAVSWFFFFFHYDFFSFLLFVVCQGARKNKSHVVLGGVSKSDRADCTSPSLSTPPGPCVAWATP